MLLASVVAIPQILVFVQTEERHLSSNTTQGLNVTIYKCESAGYTEKWQRKIYVTFITLSLLIIPACIMVYCFASIIRVVWLRACPQAAGNIDEPRVHFVTTRRSQEQSDPAVCLVGLQVATPDHQRSPRRQSLLQCSRVAFAVPRRVTLTTKRNVIKMAMSVTVGFMVCWTPHFVVTLARAYSDYQYKWTIAKSVSLLMALSHSAINPFIYIIFSTRAVRTAFVHLCQRAEPRRYQRR